MALEKVPPSDPVRHLLRLCPVCRPVLELDHGHDPLAGQRLDLRSGPAPHRHLDDLVVDALLVERLLDPPARVSIHLQECQRAPVQLDRHTVSSRR
jgi:hypothetical protein